jgi:hypothetical protein
MNSSKSYKVYKVYKVMEYNFLSALWSTDIIIHYLKQMCYNKIINLDNKVQTLKTL